MEELSPDFENFFKTGELSDSLRTQLAPDAPPPVVETPPAVVETPPVETPPVDATPPVETPPPVVEPQRNPYVEQLLQQQEEARKVLEKQVAELNARIQEASKPPVPDPVTDPLGHMMHQMKEIQDKINEFQSKSAATQQETQQQQQAAQFANGVRAQVQDFIGKQPDYLQAYEHLKNVRTQDFRALGVPEQQIPAMLNQEELNITIQAVKQGKNPAQLVYDFAKRYGYVAKAPTETPEQKVERLQKGAKAADHVASTAAPPKGVSFEAAKVASDAELTDLVSNHWEELMGGRKGIF